MLFRGSSKCKKKKKIENLQTQNNIIVTVD